MLLRLLLESLLLGPPRIAARCYQVAEEEDGDDEGPLNKDPQALRRVLCVLLLARLLELLILR